MEIESRPRLLCTNANSAAIPTRSIRGGFNVEGPLGPQRGGICGKQKFVWFCYLVVFIGTVFFANGYQFCLFLSFLNVLFSVQCRSNVIKKLVSFFWPLCIAFFVPRRMAHRYAFSFSFFSDPKALGKKSLQLHGNDLDLVLWKKQYDVKELFPLNLTLDTKTVNNHVFLLHTIITSREKRANKRKACTKKLRTKNNDYVEKIHKY